MRVIRNQRFKSHMLSGCLIVISLFQQVHAQEFYDGQTSVRGSRVIFSQDIGAAFVEALEFCHYTTGNPVKFNQYTRNRLIHLLQLNFYTLPLEIQHDLSWLRNSVKNIKASWQHLNDNQRIEFAFNILSFSYGHAVAKQMLGFNTNYPEYDTPKNQPRVFEDIVENFVLDQYR